MTKININGNEYEIDMNWLRRYADGKEGVTLSGEIYRDIVAEWLEFRDEEDFWFETLMNGERANI